MLVAKDFRKIARDALRGKWVLAVLTGWVATFLGASIFSTEGGSIDFESSEVSTELGYDLESLNIDDNLMMILIPIILSIVSLALVFTIVLIIIGGAMTLGYAKFNLKLVDNKNPQFSDIFSAFGRLGAGFCLQFLRGLYTFLWSLLFIIPGVIASFRYALAPYILQEHPEMTASEAIAESKRLMDGNKWRLFCLDLSFIGWDILCILTLGLGFVVLRPYRQAAFTVFYREISHTVPMPDVVNSQDAFQSENTDENKTYYQEV